MSQATTTRPNPDQKVAAALGLPPEIVRQERLEWNGKTVLRASFTDRFQTLIDERKLMLETVRPEDLKDLQGELKGLRLALAQISKTET